MKEFDELIFSFMNLDLNQKKAVLSNDLDQSIGNILNMMKNSNLNTDILSTNILDNLELNDEHDFLTYIYILVQQLEDMTFKYISFNNK